MESHIYRNQDKELTIDIYKPEGATEPLPAIVFFFGGGWVGGTQDQFRPFCEHLQKRGMIAAVADYRVKSRDDAEPYDCVKDAKSVMRWLRGNAEQLGIDPNRLVAGGGSAGGHLAAATACVTRWNHDEDDQSVSCIPNALALFNPVINNGPDNWGYDRVKEYYEDISPFHRVADGWPATTIFLGSEDGLISVATMGEFAENIRQHGSRCDEHYYGGQPHGFFNFKEGDNPYFQQTLQALDGFFVSLGYLDMAY